MLSFHTLLVQTDADLDVVYRCHDVDVLSWVGGGPGDGVQVGPHQRDDMGQHARRRTAAAGEPTDETLPHVLLTMDDAEMPWQRKGCTAAAAARCYEPVPQLSCFGETTCDKTLPFPAADRRARRISRTWDRLIALTAS